MASVTIDIGDTVEISFKLKFKKAEVERRPDRAAFQKVVVEATTSDNRGIFAFDRDVTTDDQVITGEMPFVPTNFQPDFFQPGQVWTVVAGYAGEDLNATADRRFTLGTVTIRDKAAS